MKKLIVLLLALFATLAIAKNEDRCCFCAADLSDSKTNQECARWLKENKPSCDYRKELPHFMSYAYSLEEDVSCNSVKIYGAYHGLSSYYYHTFFLIQDLTEHFNPQEVSFDGSTCLIFNNVDKVQESAMRISKLFPQVYFDLSGNQNEGSVFAIPLIYRPKESISMSSKMNVKAKNGHIETTFGSCSRPKDGCFYNKKDRGANNDSNTKFCMKNDKVVSQVCCLRKIVLNGVNGSWSNPGELCEI